jgi:hypothetical protein
LEDATGNPISIEGLWGLRFVNESGDDEDSDADRSPTLYFSVGIEDEGHGLLGSIRPAHGEVDRDGGNHGHGEDGDVSLRISTPGANPAHLSSSGGSSFRPAR